MDEHMAFRVANCVLTTLTFLVGFEDGKVNIAMQSRVGGGLVDVLRIVIAKDAVRDRQTIVRTSEHENT